MDFLVKFTGSVNDFMYTYILIILLIGIGVFYTIGTKFVQFRLLKDGFKAMLEKGSTDENGKKKVSSFLRAVPLKMLIDSYDFKFKS